MKLIRESKKKCISRKTILKRTLGLTIWSGFKWLRIGFGVDLIHYVKLWVQENAAQLGELQY